jgi:hypothetical protein
VGRHWNRGFGEEMGGKGKAYKIFMGKKDML